MASNTHVKNSLHVKNALAYKWSVPYIGRNLCLVFRFVLFCFFLSCFEVDCFSGRLTACLYHTDLFPQVFLC